MCGLIVRFSTENYCPPNMLRPRIWSHLLRLVMNGNVRQAPSGGRTKGALHRVKTPFGLDWLPGQDSNLRPAGYKCPSFSTGLGLSLHPPTEKVGEGVGRC